MEGDRSLFGGGIFLMRAGGWRGLVRQEGDGLAAEGDEVGGCLNCDLGGFRGLTVTAGVPVLGCLVVRGRGERGAVLAVV